MNEPIIIECSFCDLTLEPENIKEAKESGWVDIDEDEFGLGWTHLGVCPTCKEYIGVD